MMVLRLRQSKFTCVIEAEGALHVAHEAAIAELLKL
jgi:hypothetical protein